MTATTYSWQVVTDSVTDPLSPAKSATFEALRQNAVTCREMAYNSSTHAPTTAHDHDGSNSAAVYPPSPNLILASKWNDERAGTELTLYNVTIGEDKEDGGAHMQTSGDYAAAIVGESMVAANYGTAATIACSLFVKSTSAQSVGELRFGLADGSANARAGTFITGCRGTVDTTNIKEGWVRYWFAATISGALTNPLVFVARVSTTWTAEIRADCPAATLGSNLTWWGVSPLLAKSSSTALNFFLRDTTQAVPFFDHEISMRRAVKLTPV